MLNRLFVDLIPAPSCKSWRGTRSSFWKLWTERQDHVMQYSPFKALDWATRSREAIESRRKMKPWNCLISRSHRLGQIWQGLQFWKTCRGSCRIKMAAVHFLLADTQDHNCWMGGTMCTCMSANSSNSIFKSILRINKPLKRTPHRFVDVRGVTKGSTTWGRTQVLRQAYLDTHLTKMRKFRSHLRETGSLIEDRMLNLLHLIRIFWCPKENPEARCHLEPKKLPWDIWEPYQPAADAPAHAHCVRTNQNRGWSSQALSNSADELHTNHLFATEMLHSTLHCFSSSNCVETSCASLPHSTQRHHWNKVAAAHSHDLTE